MANGIVLTVASLEFHILIVTRYMVLAYTGNVLKHLPPCTLYPRLPLSPLPTLSFLITCTCISLPCAEAHVYFPSSSHTAVGRVQFRVVKENLARLSQRQPMVIHVTKMFVFFFFFLLIIFGNRPMLSQAV